MTFFSMLMAALKWTTILATSSAAVVGTGLYIFQSSLIYPASLPAGSRELVDTPDCHGMAEYESFHLETPDGERLHCYSILQPANQARHSPTILLFHANAGNMGHRLPIARVFHDRMNMNVVMLSYRGYGKSTGTPSEVGIKIDADVFLQYVLTHQVLRHTRLFAYGQSIGGAVAIHAVHKNQARFAGLIIENTFLSIRSLIPRYIGTDFEVASLTDDSVLPLAAPIARLCHQIWNSESLIDTIETPILFLSGRKDEIVPSDQMDRLFALATSPEKEWHEFPNGTHNDTVMQKDYMKYIYSFISRHTSSK